MVVQDWGGKVPWGGTDPPPQAVMDPSAQPGSWGLALIPARASAVCAGPAVSQAWQGSLFSVSVLGMAGGAAEDGALRLGTKVRDEKRVPREGQLGAG